MNRLFKVASIYLKKLSILKEDKFRTLYHIRSSGGLPGPVPNNQSINKNWTRHWLTEEPTNAIFLTSNPYPVFFYHMIGGKNSKIYVFEISESIIQEVGGMHRYDNASEIIISKKMWEEGKAKNKINFLGIMSENKWKKQFDEFLKSHPELKNILKLRKMQKEDGDEESFSSREFSQLRFSK